jgi:hypothetical protein
MEETFTLGAIGIIALILGVIAMIIRFRMQVRWFETRWQRYRNSLWSLFWKRISDATTIGFAVAVIFWIISTVIVAQLSN